MQENKPHDATTHFDSSHIPTHVDDLSNFGQAKLSLAPERGDNQGTLSEGRPKEGRFPCPLARRESVIESPGVETARAPLLSARDNPTTARRLPQIVVDSPTSQHSPIQRAHPKIQGQQNLAGELGLDRTLLPPTTGCRTTNCSPPQHLPRALSAGV